ncbi:hypothetical protein SBI_08084 [Streptomyces bingchenggensis BCW-1]|uniref:Uncharacterized protein n=1 Tax=Streptomyces bingchenggensis (strain BCW-1) TaxID=749414 RepID=D7CI24_STRBB|nr:MULTISPECIES: hypothetical protein [Streptomyces]ADI11202.1 hypothetical protein SBI_08084 [Streptomyces bingchenggensis BCW-1]
MPSSNTISLSSFTSSFVTSHCADDIPSISYGYRGGDAGYIEYPSHQY